MIDPLTALAIRHGTDKFGFHRYTPVYHLLLSRFRDRPLRLLEIGVGGYRDPDRGGQSLASWRDYFPQGRIVGIDIERKTLDLGPRVTILQGSQVDGDFLARVVADHGPFDIIIDDGSHQNAHVVESFALLFPTLAPGGVYVAEDVQTAFMPRFGGSLALEAPNSVGFFRDLARDPKTGPAGIAGIERFHNMIAVHKADPAAHAPRVAPAPGAVAPWDGLATLAATLLPEDEGALPEGEATALPDPAAAPRLPAATTTAEEVAQAFEALPMGGLLLLEGQPGPALRDWLCARFVEVDHREIAVTYPEAAACPLAATLFGLSWLADGVVLWRLPNDFPSNFAYRADHPEAARVIAQIGAALAAMEDAEETGLVAHAGLLTGIGGREAAAPLIARLEARGCRLRSFYDLALGLAAARRDRATVIRLGREALQSYPDAVQFTLPLASALLSDGQTQEADRVVVAALESNPRNAKLLLLRARTAERLGDTEGAIEQAARAAAIGGGGTRAKAQVALGRLLHQAGRSAEALTVLTEATQGPANVASRAWRQLSGVQHAQGALDEARKAADKAVELAPEQGEFRKWQARLAEEG